jgi:hypothetical protein
MTGVNKVILVGHLGGSPELHHTQVDLMIEANRAKLARKSGGVISASGQWRLTLCGQYNVTLISMTGHSNRRD